MQLTRSLLVAALLSAPAVAQAPQDARLASVLDHAAQAGDAQKQFLPNFECREDVLSQQIKKGKVDEEARMTALLRVQKDPASGRLNESYQPLGDPGQRGALPYYVVGGFGLALDYVLREHQPCYTYELKGDRLTFRAKPHAEVAALGCTNPDGITGQAIVDADDNIIHIERHVPARQAYATGFVPYAEIDLGLTTLDDRQFRMSQRIIALSDEGKNHGRFEATFTNCRLFGATITIHNGAPVDQ